MANRFYLIIPALISVFILSFLLVWPKYEDFRTMQANVREKTIELKNKEEYFVKVQETHKKLVDPLGVFPIINTALPEEPTAPSSFYYFQERAGGTGLILKEIDLEGVSVSSKSPTISETDISMSLIGRYRPAFKNFISYIENSGRLFEISEISFESPKDPEDEFFEFNINLKKHGY